MVSIIEKYFKKCFFFNLKIFPGKPSRNLKSLLEYVCKYKGWSHVLKDRTKLNHPEILLQMLAIRLREAFFYLKAS